MGTPRRAAVLGGSRVFGTGGIMTVAQFIERLRQENPDDVVVVFGSGTETFYEAACSSAVFGNYVTIHADVRKPI